ncbi:hypothetical protein EST38_g11512 [Candolleomyces aberdarensis]|uniref:Reverse transcriptase domain-containing protein n=1 Tax=Candolleomyces aberdarensis TaxID=2316362 RepID=A0A4Q2D5C2_9AGAR|nr:hypothetical protein EST38_g11512 [Candolleomyces aberdarensis]
MRACIARAKEFVADIVLDMGDLLNYHPTSVNEVEFMTSAIADAFSTAWLKHSSEYTVGPNSKEYWNDECTRTLEEYRRVMSVENHKAFRSAVKAAKRTFFDERIEEIATTNKRPWDLMDWVKERKNPPCEAIQFNGRPCHELNDLWDALHNTYNAASDRPVDLSMLDDLPDEPERQWPEFSLLELRQALNACSSRSAPGPDHITWRHLKQILALPECAGIITALADGCIATGHWPKHFKESMSVIIPKPNKASYSTPKAFRPIVLLNTLGKLIEKMISNRFQHDMIKYDLVDANQMGGVRQRSTEDAGLFLTHLVRAGWAKGLQTSVVAFDVAQFFPSINHQFLLAVLKKQGFHSKVAKFFGSYLVDRFTSYAWNRDTSDPRRADVGVGQGSALSPVLSALVIAPVMKLFRMKGAGLGCTLISYVDDGDIIVQSPEISTNCTMLYHAYGIVFDLFTRSGLALEHDKTELFHFTRARTGFDRPLDLGYAPYMGDTPLRPKTYWRYLGFYFDRKLTFKEHVRYYTTKALTTVTAMRMLGNSTRGLSPRNKRILYRACVVPIATYGHRLWYFEGAKVKGVLKSLNSMQRKAALWITGAFRTSPTGGVESLAGLPPISLHIQKLSQRAIYRTATLSDTHPLRSLFKGEHAKAANPALGAACWMSRDRQRNVRDAITETSAKLGTLTETYSPCAEENTPGLRLMDRHHERVTFNSFDPKPEDALAKRRSLLDSTYRRAMSTRNTACCGTDCSVPKRTAHQATASFVIDQAHKAPITSTWVAGRVLSACAELFAIRSAIVRATLLEDCDHIIVFTDSMAAARRAVDPSVHSGQAHSLAVCKTLSEWFADKASRSLEFIETPSKLKWGLQQQAHSAARSLPPVSSGRRPATSLDSVRKHITQSALDTWGVRFQSVDYRGSQFLGMNETKGTAIAPTYANGGSWMKSVGEDTKLCTRMCRAILNHAPIGEYYCRFNIPEESVCTCGAERQTREHIITRCPNMNTRTRMPKLLNELIGFLQQNPNAFGFRSAPEGVG